MYKIARDYLRSSARAYLADNLQAIADACYLRSCAYSMMATRDLLMGTYSMNRNEALSLIVAAIREIGVSHVNL